MGSAKLKILDLSTLLPGPFASYLLAKNGAKVTKAEDVKNGDLLRQMLPTSGGISVLYKSINDNKKVINVDFRSDLDMAKIKKSIKESDVLIENYRPGRMEKIGLGFEECKELNPKIVFCSIVGYGSKHPMYGKAAHDLNVLGLSGYLNYNGSFQVPSLPLADIFTSYEASIAILTALLDGGGKKLEISMFDSMLRASTFISSAENFLKRDIKPNEFILWGNFPCYSLYKTKDDKFMALATIEPVFWSDFCSHADLADLDNCQFDIESREKVRNKIATKTQKEWTGLNIECFTPVLSFLESQKLGYA